MVTLGVVHALSTMMMLLLLMVPLMVPMLLLLLLLPLPVLVWNVQCHRIQNTDASSVGGCTAAADDDVDDADASVDYWVAIDLVVVVVVALGVNAAHIYEADVCRVGIDCRR